MDFKPYKPVIYSEKVDFSALVSLPYDVLSRQKIAELIESSPNHVMNIEAGINAPDVGNPYFRAGESLDRMLKENVLVQLPDACYVITEEKFNLAGEEKTIRRIWGIVPNQDYVDGKVMRHENTRQPALDDRISLLEALDGFKTKPTWLGVKDSSGELERFMEKTIGTKGIDWGETNGRRLKVAYVTEQSEISLVQDILSTQRSLIYDGHHGFAASAKFGEGKADGQKYMLCAISSEFNPGYSILPTYRILNGSLPELTDEFEFVDMKIVDPSQIHARLAGLKYHFAAIEDGSIRVFKLKEKYQPNGNPLEHLDVYQLHKKLLEPRGFSNGNLDYDADLGAAMEKGRCVLYVGPPTQEQVWALAENGLTTPPKSTLYVAKLLSGLFSYSPK